MYLTPFNTPWSLWSNESFDTKHQIFRHEHWQAQFWAIPNEQHWYINIAQFFSDPGIDILEINSDCLPCWYCENKQVEMTWSKLLFFFVSFQFLLQNEIHHLHFCPCLGRRLGSPQISRIQRARFWKPDQGPEALHHRQGQGWSNHHGRLEDLPQDWRWPWLRKGYSSTCLLLCLRSFWWH